MGAVVVSLPYEPTAKQLEAARACLDPAARVVALDGAYRSSETQAGGRILAEWAMAGEGGIYLVGRSGYRALKDSTERAMLYGDGSLPPLIPPEAVDRYRAADEAVRLRNGSEILFRSLEEQNIEKLRGLTLAGALVDQIEELDGGDAGERILDTLLGRLSDPRGPRKLIAISNPAGLTHFVFRRLVNPATRDAGVRHVHFRLHDNAMNLPEDYVAAMLATRETRPHWYRSFVEGVWGSFEGMAYAEWDPAVHVVEQFEIPAVWERFESMDHGAANPTAWLLWAADHDGNLVVVDEYYRAGEVVSTHAAEVLARRKAGWERQDERGRRVPNLCWGDPSVWASHGLTTRFNEPASVGTEYAERGVRLLKANNDRAAGYMRLLELVRPDPDRLFPDWHPRRGERGSPRLFVVSRCVHLLEQMQSAPVAADGVGAGQIVDPKWESAHGHAHAAARYGAMSRPGPSPVPDPSAVEPEDPRAAVLWRHERRVEAGRPRRTWTFI